MAFAFFKKKTDVNVESGELIINMPGMEKQAVVTEPPAVPTNPVINVKTQRSCDDIYASQHGILMCPHCETIFINEQRQCPACGFHF